MKKRNKIVALSIAILLLLGSVAGAFSHVFDSSQSKPKPQPEEKVITFPPLLLEEMENLSMEAAANWGGLEIMPIPEVLNNPIEDQELSNMHVLAMRAITNQNLGDFSAALADWDELEGLKGPNFVVAANRGNIYFAIGDLEAAISEWTNAIELDSKYAFLFTNRGIAYGRLGKLDAGIVDFLQAIHLEPEEYTNYNSLGFIICKRNTQQQLTIILWL